MPHSPSLVALTHRDSAAQGITAPPTPGPLQTFWLLFKPCHHPTTFPDPQALDTTVSPQVPQPLFPTRQTPCSALPECCPFHTPRPLQLHTYQLQHLLGSVVFSPSSLSPDTITVLPQPLGLASVPQQSQAGWIPLRVPHRHTSHWGTVSISFLDLHLEWMEPGEHTPPGRARTSLNHPGSEGTNAEEEPYRGPSWGMKRITSPQHQAHQGEEPEWSCREQSQLLRLAGRCELNSLLTFERVL